MSTFTIKNFILTVLIIPFTILFSGQASAQQTKAATIVPLSEIMVRYNNGLKIKYYYDHKDSINIAMYVSVERNYGKYYVVHLAIHNLTEKSFNFFPAEIQASLFKKGVETKGEVLPEREYMKKVRHRQNLAAFLVAEGESDAADFAGRSSSYSTSTSSGNYNSTGNISGNVGNTYGSVSGNVSGYGTSTTNTVTHSFNGAASYAARQNAQRKINKFQNQQQQEKTMLNEGYLKINTILGGQKIIGNINVKYKKADKLKIIVPVNGKNYVFWWQDKKSF